jgi:hypothetical protein
LCPWNEHVGECSHVIEVSYFALLVANDWEGEVATRDLVDVFDPSSVALNSIGRQANQLSAALSEFRLKLRECTQLGCTDRCIILRVREQHNPVITDELVEVDWAIGGISIEIWSDRAQAEAVTFKCQ